MSKILKILIPVFVLLTGIITTIIVVINVTKGDYVVNPDDSVMLVGYNTSELDDKYVIEVYAVDAKEIPQLKCHFITDFEDIKETLFFELRDDKYYANVDFIRQENIYCIKSFDVFDNEKIYISLENINVFPYTKDNPIIDEYNELTFKTSTRNGAISLIVEEADEVLSSVSYKIYENNQDVTDNFTFYSEECVISYKDDYEFQPTIGRHFYKIIASTDTGRGEFDFDVTIDASYYFKLISINKTSDVVQNNILNTTFNPSVMLKYAKNVYVDLNYELRHFMTDEDVLIYANESPFVINNKMSFLAKGTDKIVDSSKNSDILTFSKIETSKGEIIIDHSLNFDFFDPSFSIVHSFDKEEYIKNKTVGQITIKITDEYKTNGLIFISLNDTLIRINEDSTFNNTEKDDNSLNVKTSVSDDYSLYTIVIDNIYFDDENYEFNIPTIYFLNPQGDTNECEEVVVGYNFNATIKEATSYVSHKELIPIEDVLELSVKVNQDVSYINDLEFTFVTQKNILFTNKEDLKESFDNGTLNSYSDVVLTSYATVNDNIIINLTKIFEDNNCKPSDVNIYDLNINLIHSNAVLEKIDDIPNEITVKHRTLIDGFEIVKKSTYLYAIRVNTLFDLKDIVIKQLVISLYKTETIDENGVITLSDFISTKTISVSLDESDETNSTYLTTEIPNTATAIIISQVSLSYKGELSVVTLFKDSCDVIIDGTEKEVLYCKVGEK